MTECDLVFLENSRSPLDRWEWRNVNPISRTLARLLVIMMLLVTPCPVIAALFTGMDLDTLTEKCDLLVEGQIIAVKDGVSGQVEVRVSHVYRGNTVKENDRLLVEVGYRKPGTQFMDTKPLETGDVLFWFLSKTSPQALGMAKPDIWRPLPGGVKLVFNGHVAEFSQHYMNPGPVIAETEERYVKHGQPTVEEYRELVMGSFVEVADFQSKLKTAVANKDSKALVELLRQRAARTATRSWGRDELANDAGTALAELHDYNSLDAAMKITGMRGGGQFTHGFGTLDGIQYLLARINNPKLESIQRIGYVNALPRPSDLRAKDGTVSRPAHYLLGIAELAIANEKDRPFSESLLRVVDGWTADKSRLDDPSRADLADALVPLKEFYRSTHDPAVQCQVELLFWHADPAAYQSLRSECGPVISRASIPDDLEHYAKPVGRDLIASFSLAYCFPDALVHAVQNESVLEGSDGVTHTATYSTKSGSSFDPSTFSMNTGSQSGFTCTIRPPTDLPGGKYRLYLRFKELGVVVGRSHSVQIVIP